MDTGDVKVIEAKLEEVTRRLDELLVHSKTLEGSVDRARGFAASLNGKLEERVRALELELAQVKVRWSLIVAGGAVLVGPLMTWALGRMLGG